MIGIEENGSGNSFLKGILELSNGFSSSIQGVFSSFLPKVQILAVHIQSGLFQRKLSRKQLKLRVKYGAPGVSIYCDTAQARLSHQAAPAAARFVHRLDRPDQDRAHGFWVKLQGGVDVESRKQRQFGREMLVTDRWIFGHHIFRHLRRFFLGSQMDHIWAGLLSDHY